MKFAAVLYIILYIATTLPIFADGASIWSRFRRFDPSATAAANDEAVAANVAQFDRAADDSSTASGTSVATTTSAVGPGSDQQGGNVRGAVVPYNEFEARLLDPACATCSTGLGSPIGVNIGQGTGSCDFDQCTGTAAGQEPGDVLYVSHADAADGCSVIYTISITSTEAAAISHVVGIWGSACCVKEFSSPFAENTDAFCPEGNGGLGGAVALDPPTCVTGSKVDCGYNPDTFGFEATPPAPFTRTFSMVFDKSSITNPTGGTITIVLKGGKVQGNDRNCYREIIGPSCSVDPEDSEHPSGMPSQSPSDTPSNTPSETPSGTPTQSPSAIPSNIPTDKLQAPSAMPSASPTDKLQAPSAIPSNNPTDKLQAPSAMPSASPTDKLQAPSAMPSASPTDKLQAPSAMPSAGPTPDTSDPAEPTCAIDVELDGCVAADCASTNSCLCQEKIYKTKLKATQKIGSTGQYLRADFGCATEFIPLPLEVNATFDLECPDYDNFDAKTTFCITDSKSSSASCATNGAPDAIHTSCSAIYIAGQPAPLDNPKGDPSPTLFVVDYIEVEKGASNTRYVSRNEVTLDAESSVCQGQLPTTYLGSSSHSRNSGRSDSSHGGSTKSEGSSIKEYVYNIHNIGESDIDVIGGAGGCIGTTLMADSTCTFTSESSNVNVTASASTQSGPVCFANYTSDLPPWDPLPEDCGGHGKSSGGGKSGSGSHRGRSKARSLGGGGSHSGSGSNYKCGSNKGKGKGGSSSSV